MAYTETTWGDLKAALAERLTDASMVFYVEREIELYLGEALRTWGLVSGYWRERGSVTLVAGQPFYDLRTDLSGALITPTITDRDIIEYIQYHLLENAVDQSSWSGTTQFTYDDVSGAVSRRAYQFRVDTGVIIDQEEQAGVVGGDGRQTLAETILDVRRMVWIGAAPFDYFSQVWREDEFAMTAGDPDWAANSGTPYSFSIMAGPPLTVQLVAIPQSNGTMRMLTVDRGPLLDPGAGATVLDIPDNVAAAVKWGALADLLGKDGPAQDVARAAFCEERYRQLVMLSKMLSLVVASQINGVSVQPDTVFNADVASPGWEGITGTPTTPLFAGWNMMGLFPVPLTALHSVILDVVKNAPVPAADATAVQIDTSQIDGILDYAEHLALFKCGGAELRGSLAQAQNFLMNAITYNQRLGASARYVITPKQYAYRESQFRPRQQNADALGSADVATAAQFPKQRVPARLK